MKYEKESLVGLAYGPYSSMTKSPFGDESKFDLLYRPERNLPNQYTSYEAWEEAQRRSDRRMEEQRQRVLGEARHRALTADGVRSAFTPNRSDQREQDNMSEAFRRYRKFLVKSYEGVSDEDKLKLKEEISLAVTSIYDIAGAPMKPRVVFARSIKDFCFLQFFASSMSLVPMMAEVASWSEFKTWFGNNGSLSAFTNDLYTAFHKNEQGINPYEPSEELQTLLSKLRQDFNQKRFTGGEERCIEVLSEALKRFIPHSSDSIDKVAKGEGVRSKLFDVFKSFNSNPIPDSDIVHAAYQHEFMYGKDECWTSIIKVLQFSRDVLFLNGFCVVLEPAAIMRLDNRVRFHSLDTPAFLDNDEEAHRYYSLCGVEVKRDYIENFDKLKPKTILRESNSEVRRVLMEKYGHEKFVRDLGAKPLHTDDFGTLYRIELPEDEPLCMVAVINKTAEPDGSFKEYWLRVPPDITTAQAACAWTFRMKPEEYVLAGES